MNKITVEHIQALVKASTFTDTRMGLKTTVVCMTLPNGFEIIGTSSCVCPANYDHNIGVGIAKSHIVEKLWELEGYRLQCELVQAPTELRTPEPQATTFLDRLRAEKRDLTGKIEKLAAFVQTPTYHSLSAGERERLSLQLGVMREYETILVDRLDVYANECRPT